MQLEKELAEKLRERRLAPPQLTNPESLKPKLRGKYLTNLDEVADIMWLIHILF